LARLYASQLERASGKRDELDRIYFEELVKQHDDGGALLGARRADGAVRLSSRTPGQVVFAAAVEERRRLIAGRESAAGPPPFGARLPPGRYLGPFVDAAGREVRFPLTVAAGKLAEVAIDLEAGGGPGPEEVLVPGGPAQVTGDGPGSLRTVDVPAF